MFIRFKLTNEFSCSAVHVERVVTLLLVRVSVLEEKTVRAELGLGDVVHALVVEVALLRVREETIFFWAFEIWEKARSED